MYYCYFEGGKKGAIVTIIVATFPLWKLELETEIHYLLKCPATEIAGGQIWNDKCFEG
jgi:hypothetical protein